jgi:ribosomal protein S18 acetylase RimI-like enzyme
MSIIHRFYQGEQDYWRMRAFLREVFRLNGGLERSWHVARLDYARWHTCVNCAGVRLEDVAHLWEENGQIVAFLMPDGGVGEAHLCVHPGLVTRELEHEMIRVAEERLASVDQAGTRKLVIWSPTADTRRQSHLQQRAFVRAGEAEHQWRRQLDAPVEVAPPAPGYVIRSLGDGLELLERCYASGLGFHDGDIRTAVDNRNDPTWYRNIQTAPLYRRDLDLVAVAADGAIAAFCTIWFDDATRSAYFEPVASVPAHQRRGLAKAVMTEGLRRVQRMGATIAFVSGYSAAANALYRSVMGPAYELYEPWVKEWKQQEHPGLREIYE